MGTFRRFCLFHALSSEQLIKCGARVPQGCILGPLFFLLQLFADDTNLTAAANSVTDLDDAVNSDPENLRRWYTCSQQTKPKCSQGSVYVNWLKVYDKKHFRFSENGIENM